jgi:phage gp45-like
MNRTLLGGLITIVTDVDIDADGNATCIDAEAGDELEPTVGWQFGFYSRPRTKVRGIALKVGGRGNNSIVVAFRDKQYELSLQSGEAGVQNAFGASTLWDKNGNIVVTPGGSGKVQLGAATTPDAAVLGTTFDAALDTFLTAMTVFVSAANTLGLALVPTTGVTPGAPATFTAAATAMTTAANAFKNANYLSQTVALK